MAWPKASHWLIEDPAGEGEATAGLDNSAPKPAVPDSPTKTTIPAVLHGNRSLHSESAHSNCQFPIPRSRAFCVGE
jgi:hypothetical protein